MKENNPFKRKSSRGVSTTHVTVIDSQRSRKRFDAHIITIPQSHTTVSQKLGTFTTEQSVEGEHNRMMLRAFHVITETTEVLDDAGVHFMSVIPTLLALPRGSH